MKFCNLYCRSVHKSVFVIAMCLLNFFNKFIYRVIEATTLNHNLLVFATIKCCKITSATNSTNYHYMTYRKDLGITADPSITVDPSITNYININDEI